MADLRQDLNDEIDFNFFDDNEISETNNNAFLESTKTEIKRDSIDVKNASDREGSLINSGSILISSSDELKEESLHSSKRSVSSRRSLSAQSNASSTGSRKSNKSSSRRTSPSRDLSDSPRAPSESDVTTVSSLDSEPRQSVIVSRKTPSRNQTRDKHVTHIDNSEDVDRVQPEAILRAMIRIHEQRRAMRQLRPKWVDPNTKDYSVSGLTAKMNLVPQRIVTAPRKNMRNNPFYSHYSEASRRPYHTALNREKELDRIERENRTIYERLKKIQPSPGITKHELLREYSKINRFSLPPNLSSLSGTMTTSNSRSSSQAHVRTHSSASIHDSRSDRQRRPLSRKHSNNGRVMSASSLTTTTTAASGTNRTQTSSVVKKSRY